MQGNGYVLKPTVELAYLLMLSLSLPSTSILFIMLLKGWGCLIVRIMEQITISIKTKVIAIHGETVVIFKAVL